SSGAHSRDPLAPRNDVAPRSRGADSARVVPNHCPSKERGRRESRAPDAPAASYAKVKSIRASHHRFTGTIRPSLRNGFNGFLRARPGDRAFLPPSPARCVSIDTNLISASGYQAHTTSPSTDNAHVFRAT